MRDDDFVDKRRSGANQFEDIFQCLLSGEQLDLYEEGVSSMFEVIAANLLAEAPGREFMWYDGVVGLAAKISKARQIEFTGEMWVGDVGNARIQWKEDFRATVTDKRITKQGIWVTIWIGADRTEGELSSAFGLAE